MLFVINKKVTICKGIFLISLLTLFQQTGIEPKKHKKDKVCVFSLETNKQKFRHNIIYSGMIGMISKQISQKCVYCLPSRHILHSFINLFLWDQLLLLICDDDLLFKEIFDNFLHEAIKVLFLKFFSRN